MINLLKNEEVKNNIVTGVKFSGKIIGNIAISYVQALVITTGTFMGVGLAGMACEKLKDKMEEKNKHVTNDEN